MFSKKSIRSSIKMSAVCAGILALIASSITAMADEPVSFGKAGVGANLNTTGGTSGSAASVAATLSGGSISMHNEDSPLYSAIGSGQYNAFGVNNQGKFTTGLAGRIQLFVGGTLLDSEGHGCDIYGGIGGGANGQANTGADSWASFSVGPETGLLCQTGKLMFMISPFIGLGGASVSPTSGPSVSNSNFIAAGGRVRVAIADRGMIVAEASVNPKISDGQTDKYVQARLETLWKLDDKNAAGGYATGVQVQDSNNNSHSGGEAGLTWVRTF